MTQQTCENRTCSYREPWKPFGFQTHHIDGEYVTLCANCTHIYITTQPGYDRTAPRKLRKGV